MSEQTIAFEKEQCDTEPSVVEIISQWLERPVFFIDQGHAEPVGIVVALHGEMDEPIGDPPDVVSSVLLDVEGRGRLLLSSAISDG